MDGLRHRLTTKVAGNGYSPLLRSPRLPPTLPSYTRFLKLRDHRPVDPRAGHHLVDRGPEVPLGTVGGPRGTVEAAGNAGGLQVRGVVSRVPARKRDADRGPRASDRGNVLLDSLDEGAF